LNLLIFLVKKIKFTFFNIFYAFWKSALIPRKILHNFNPYFEKAGNRSTIDSARSFKESGSLKSTFMFNRKDNDKNGWRKNCS